MGLFTVVMLWTNASTDSQENLDFLGILIDKWSSRSLLSEFCILSVRVSVMSRLRPHAFTDCHQILNQRPICGSVSKLRASREDFCSQNYQSLENWNPCQNPDWDLNSSAWTETPLTNKDRSYGCGLASFVAVGTDRVSLPRFLDVVCRDDDCLPVTGRHLHQPLPDPATNHTTASNYSTSSTLIDFTSALHGPLSRTSNYCIITSRIEFRRGGKNKKVWLSILSQVCLRKFCTRCTKLKVNNAIHGNPTKKLSINARFLWVGTL